MSNVKNKYILNMASDEEDVRILNTDLIDLIICDERPSVIEFEDFIASIIVFCRQHENMSLNVIRAALATAIFMLHNKSSVVCMLEGSEKFVAKIH